MNLREYGDILNLELRMTGYPNQDGRWTASFYGCETKTSRSSSILTSEYGNGKSPQEALEAYVAAIRGKILVVNAECGKDRREYEVPMSLKA